MTLLAIDIGNTNMTFGVFRGKRLAGRFDIPTAGYSAHLLEGRLKGRVPDDAIICSVVPAASRKLENDLKRIFGLKPYVLGKNAAVPIRNLYRKRGQVGQDRLVNAYAGVMLYGSPLVVIDTGTAVTFDCISRRREYLGGMILPGLRISLEALHRRTALLPAVSLRKPKEFIGRETSDSILSGVVYGMAALIDDLSLRIKKEIGSGARVIGTGGNIKLLSRYCRSLDAVDLDLTLKGLFLIHSSCGRD